MRRRLFPLFLLLSVCAFTATAQTGPKLIEAESKLIVGEKNAELHLAITGSGRRETVPYTIELLGLDNRSVATAKNDLSLVPGKRTYKIDLSIGTTLKDAGDGLPWYRLRYQIGATNGIISLSQLLTDDFEMRVAAAENVIPGDTYIVRVRALNPISTKPVKDVIVEATLQLEIDTEEDDDELGIQALGRSNDDGYLELKFKIPEGIKIEDADLRIKGRKGGLVRELDEDLDNDNATATVLLTADKPIYQPGQDFRVRALFLDANNIVLANRELEFSVKDGDDTLLYRATVSTSSFGIAAISWKIPDNAKLGEYRVIVDSDDEDLDADQMRFKVTRYDLPNFAVSAKPDKTYYLPGDDEASIVVSGDYLFGKPVPKGKVRVARQTERRWNWREQKYDVTEEEPVEGVADESGKFTARFDIKSEMSGMLSRSWERFSDVDYVAYFTDPTTNRTEQKRFRIRLSKEPIHIYVIRHDAQHRDLPLNLYFSTFYADGTPAVCDLTVTPANSAVKEVLARRKTNSYGISKVSPNIPQDLARLKEVELYIEARDKKGAKGTTDIGYYPRDKDVLQLRSAQTILKPGEPIELFLESSRNKDIVYLDIVKNYTVIESRLVTIRNGKAKVVLPYRPEFRGELTVGAYNDEETYRWDSDMRASLGVIYPQEDGLNLKTRFSNATYKPGEEAKVKFSVLDGRGTPSESALGIVVFDKAVEQRARTDEDFGSYFSPFSRYIGYDKYIGDVSLRDLNKIDLSKPISPELQLVAEMMLLGNSYYPDIYHDGGNPTSASSAYAKYFSDQLDSVRALLVSDFKRTGRFPSDAESLRKTLADNGKDLSEMLDPWGSEYYFEFDTNQALAIDTFKTSGPDKIRGNDDDFTVLNVSVGYFEPTGDKINRAISAYVRDGGQYVRDLPAFWKAAMRFGILPEHLKDRWGRDSLIHFEIVGRQYSVRIESLGPNGVKDVQYGDDFDLWKSYHDYFYESEKRINVALDQHVNIGKRQFPKTLEEFRQVLKAGGVDLATIRDGDGRPVVLRSSVSTQYSDRVTYVDGKRIVKPVTDQLLIFSLHMNDKDEAELTRFSTVTTDRPLMTSESSSELRSVSYLGGRGALSGTVFDSQGAIVPGAKVTVTREGTTETHEATSDAEGRFLIANILSGLYTVQVDAIGFKSMIRNNVEVRSQNMIEMRVTLEVGSISEVVTVAAGAVDVVETSSAMIATNVTKTSVGIKLSMLNAGQTSTPRLREFFPETLYWQPELITDKKGRAEATFKMADNITTWKMYTIASTKKGKIGVAETEVTAFQPFFVDLDPPKFLTTGDEIFLPTQVRNYTEKKQNVNVTMSPADWFSFLGCDTSGRNASVNERGDRVGRSGGPSVFGMAASCDTTGMKQTTAVASGESENAVFGFKATTPIKEGKQRVTAIAQGDSDAIERPVTVRPDGREVVHTESRYFDGNGRFDVNFPANALANSSTAEIKIYPNLLAHVAESVDGLLQRPYGCGEQTISSTYPNLMIIKFAGGAEGRTRRISEATEKKARKFLLAGYERLLGYQLASGGFGYWGGKDDADLALTAYALRFLADASKFIDVDENIVKKAETFLISQQRADGSWNRKYNWENTEDLVRAKTTTTYIARVLASLQGVSSPHVSKGSGDTAAKQALTKSLAYLKQRNAEIDDPYSLALFGLAAHDSGDAQLAVETAKTLRSLARDEAGATYWNLESNTAFNGWGTAGRVETTALATQLLIKTGTDAEMTSRAMVFLLKNKDRYGVWYSTQTTINVLDAFVTAMSSAAASGPQMLDVLVNGTKLQTIEIGPDKLDQIIVPLDGKLAAAANSIELRSSTKGSPLMAQVVANHYIDWRDADTTGRTVNHSRALELEYTCDKTSAAIMNEISCSVKAERVGYRGYGMLLAEIGTPPGADVSRESLQAAMDADYSISRYDILPDRIVVYMWSKPGGTKLNFKFRPRYGINAQTPASTVYDYYNPEAQATVAPMRFTVK